MLKTFQRTLFRGCPVITGRKAWLIVRMAEQMLIQPHQERLRGVIVADLSTITLN